MDDEYSHILDFVFLFPLSLSQAFYLHCFFFFFLLKLVCLIATLVNVFLPLCIMEINLSVSTTEQKYASDFTEGEGRCQDFCC